MLSLSTRLDCFHYLQISSGIEFRGWNRKLLKQASHVSVCVSSSLSFSLSSRWLGASKKHAE